LVSDLYSGGTGVPGSCLASAASPPGASGRWRWAWLVEPVRKTAAIAAADRYFFISFTTNLLDFNVYWHIYLETGTT
jgi:hypothetical protein